MSLGGSSPSGTSEVRSNAAPWSGQQPYLETGFSRAQSDILNKPIEYYPGSTVVPFSGQTEAALGGTEQRAMAGSPLNQAAQGEVSKTLGGDYLSAGNPAFGAMMNRIEGQVRPMVDSRFSASGRYGSGAHAGATSRALTDAAAQLEFSNYQPERARMLQAAQYAPQLAQQDYFDLGQLGQVGAARERQAGAELQDRMSRFNFAQMEPRQRVMEYMPLVAGGQFGGSTVQQQPIYSNNFATGLGALGTLAGIGGTLFGSGGIWPGAL